MASGEAEGGRVSARDTYNWVDPANPRGGYEAVWVPETREGALALMSHLDKEVDCKAMEAAFDEGFKIGGMKRGLEYMRDTAAEWRQDRYVPPAREASQ